ncbi:hypothetical protein llap_13823 [Limosa lapponica baueri]|uniref:Dolichyldiphosphatase n=1 Tax=Limosa lapponica baueri TaxID=1758121 RepID=A0A2I0TQ12_LIMLA|nr:hypothetical protein llap_13823 [Limosa lapponica baueri]
MHLVKNIRPAAVPQIDASIGSSGGGGEAKSCGDFSGQLLAYLSLGPIFIIVGFVTLIIFKRELHTISFLGGLAFNEGVNWLIKNVIREPRPCEEAHSTVTTKYGMPSSHSQFMWFFSVYSFLFLYLRMHQTNNARFLDLLWRHVLSICLVTVALLVSYSRVYLLYHTWSQVLYGGVAGSIMAIAWFAFTQEILTPLFPRIAAWFSANFFIDVHQGTLIMSLAVLRSEK